MDVHTNHKHNPFTELVLSEWAGLHFKIKFVERKQFESCVSKIILFVKFYVFLYSLPLDGFFLPSLLLVFFLQVGPVGLVTNAVTLSGNVRGILDYQTIICSKPTVLHVLKKPPEGRCLLLRRHDFPKTWEEKIREDQVKFSDYSLSQCESEHTINCKPSQNSSLVWWKHPHMAQWHKSLLSLYHNLRHIHIWKTLF